MMRLVFVVLFVVSVGCARREVATRPRCEQAPDGALAWLKPGVLLVGELHGTTEIPAVISRLACLSSLSMPTIVALELPVDERGAIGAFLDQGDERKLLASPFWSAEFQDGRSSVAMLQLLRDVRHLRAKQANVEVALFAPGANRTRSHEEEMADQLLAIHRARPEATILVLVGRTHAKKAVGAPWDPNFKPMAWYLSQTASRVMSVLVTHATGTAWVCCKPTHCAPHDYSGTEAGAPRFLEGSTEAGFDGALFVGPIRASLPAATPQPLPIQ